MNNTTSILEMQGDKFVSSEQRATRLEAQCQEAIKNKSTGAYAPLPLQRTTIPPKPFPFDALGPIAGAAARRMHEIIQAPDAICGQSILSTLSLACQGYVNVKRDGAEYPTSL